MNFYYNIEKAMNYLFNAFAKSIIIFYQSKKSKIKKVDMFMKTATKIVSKLLAATLALTLGAAALTSCGSGASYTDGNTEYFIGATGPLTGDASSYGISVEKGAELAVEEINAQGGLNGVTFHFEMLDDGATADKAATGYTTLYEKGMQISIGSVTSGSCASFAASSKDDKVLFMTPPLLLPMLLRQATTDSECASEIPSRVLSQPTPSQRTTTKSA